MAGDSPIDRLLALATGHGLILDEATEFPRVGGVLHEIEVSRSGKVVGRAWAMGFGPRAAAVARDAAAADLLPVGG